MHLHRPFLLACALGLGLANALPAQYPPNEDPPARVGRLSFLGGSVSLFVNGATDWSPASLNYPLTSDDAIWSDVDGRAEVHLGPSAIRIGPQSSLTFGEVSDSVTQVRLDQGSIDVRVRYLNGNDVYEIDTPAGIVSIFDAGHYRIDVTSDGRRTTVTVRDGSAQITVGDRDYPVGAGRSATLTGANRPPILGGAIAVDDWENWANDRDSRENATQSSRYVSPDMVGYEDLDDNGTWQVDPGYGPVWTPRNVPAGWAPYRFGHWESVQPWGWTWIDDAPWGFAPFHYGRWVSVRGRWGWLPGATRERAVYAPALVAFVGGSNWGISAVFGSGGGVGWIPLGPGEPYQPAYRASPTYIRRVNVATVNVTRIDVTRIDVSRIQYVNRNVPGGITAVPRDDFERSRPVGRAVIPMRPTDIATAQPSPVPLATGRPIAPPPRGTTPDRNPGRGSNGRNGVVVVRPPTPANVPVTPPPPPQQWRSRPRGGQDPQRPPQTTPPPATPPPGTPPPPPDRGRGRGGPPPTTTPPPVTPPPVTQPPPPPPDRGRGRGGPPPTTTPPPVTPPPVTPPPPPPPPATPPPPPDRGRGRGGPPPATTPPPVTPPPVTPPPPPPPATPPPPPDRGRGRGGPPPSTTPPPVTPPPGTNPPATPPPQPGKPPTDPRSRPGAPGTDAGQASQVQRTKMIARQAQEMSDLDRRQAAQLQQTPDGPARVQLQKKLQEDKKALADKQQQERDAFDKQHQPQVNI